MNINMKNNILLCTVGGSYQPIITAIQSLNPVFTYFLCTTGDNGSESQIIGKGKVIKKKSCDEKCTLPNIPAQLGMIPDQYNVVHVESDDLDKSFNVVLTTIAEVRRRFPDSGIHADYTGGTKGMSVSLVLAALESNINLHLVRGQRSDLIKVTDGTQWGVPVDYETIRFRREMQFCLKAWQQYGYAQSVIALQAMQQPMSPDLQQQLLTARNISKAFDAWDRFDHQAAQNIFSSYAKELGKIYSSYFITIGLLTKEGPKKEPALIHDLWLNAQRRACQGRYDDAVARVYRILEWAAQWTLKIKCDIDTSDIPEDFIPADVKIIKNRDGKFQAPLFQAWQLVASKTNGNMADFYKKHWGEMRQKIEMRNNSILAHGFHPIDQQRWNAIEKWMKEAFWHCFERDARELGIKALPPQLPDAYTLDGKK
jgi:hypothetical protein